MTDIHPPPDGTEAHRWWVQGAADDAACRDEGLSAEVRSMRDCLESLARLDPQSTDADLACALADIITAGNRRRRIRLAMHLVFR